MLRCGRVVTSQLRGEKVVAVILQAALDEITERGYLGFSVEGVAERAGVNKTTVYRRWPTREDLLRAALTSEGSNVFAVPEGKPLEPTLLFVARKLTALLRTRRGRALYTLLIHAESREGMSELLPPENRQAATEIFARAVAQGELRPDTNVELLVGVFYGAVMQQALLMPRAPGDAVLRQTIDLVLASSRPAERPARVAGVRAARA